MQLFRHFNKAEAKQEADEITAIGDVIGTTDEETEEITSAEEGKGTTEPRPSAVSMISTWSTTSTYGERGWLWRQFQAPCGCPNHWTIQILSAVVIILLLWALLYAVLKDEAAPHGGLFKLVVLVLSAFLGGQLVGLIKLPPLVGMMLAGVILRSVGFFNVSGIYLDIIVILRGIALTIILIKAGLGLEGAALLRLSLVVLRLGIVPCVAEAVGAAMVCHFFLGFPWLWGLVLGSILSAVSPAVQVPPLLYLKEEGYGRKKGITTLCLAATGLDDVTAISMFGVFKSMLFTKGDITMQILRGPLELMLGLACGVAWGFLAGCLPHRDDAMVVCARTTMLACGGLCAIFGSSALHIHGAGPLACITAAFTSGLCWNIQGWPNERNPVQRVFARIWRILQLVLFGLIGAEVDLRILELVTVGYGVCVIFGGLFVRIIICCIVVLGAGLNIKEIIFVNLAWIPKASVPAALGPVPLDTVRKSPNPSEEDLVRASLVLTFSVLSILISAPLGAIGLGLGGPRLLTKDRPPKRRRRKSVRVKDEENKN